MPFDPTAFDTLTAEQLRERGSLKWSVHPGAAEAWVAEMDLPPAREITAALTHAVAEGAYGYLPPALAHRTREACAAWYRRTTQWDVEARDVFLVPDVLAALEVTLRTVAGPGAVAVVTTPAYMPFLTRPGMLGHEVLTAPAVPDSCGLWSYDLETLDRVLGEAAARSRLAGRRAVLVLCNPWNPVGRVLTRPELHGIAEVVERHDALVFSDEIHAPIRYDGAAHVPYGSVSEATARHTVTATSASKAWNLAGLKCAEIVVTDPELRAVLERPETLVGREPSTLGALAGAVAFEQGEGWLALALDYLDGNRQAFAREIASIGGARYAMPEGTYLAWIDLRDVAPGGRALPVDLAKFFLDAGVAVVDGAACGAPGCVRVNLALPRPLLVDAARAIVEAVNAY